MPMYGPAQQATANELLVQVFDLKGLAFYLVPVGIGVTGWLVGRYSNRVVDWFKGPPLDEAEAKKLSAKRTNEHLKLFAGFCNTVGAAIIGAALIVPYLTQHATNLEAPAFLWSFFGAGLHILGHAFLRGMRSEG